MRPVCRTHATKEHMRTHTLDVYGTELHLATTRREWKKLAKTYRVLDDWTPERETAGQVSTFALTPKRGLAQLVVVIWINVKQHGNDTGALIDTLAHEASHAAGRILEHTGHTVPGTDEPHAYLCGWLTRWVYEGCTNDRPNRSETW